MINFSAAKVIGTLSLEKTKQKKPMFHICYSELKKRGPLMLRAVTEHLTSGELVLYYTDKVMI